MTPIQDVFMLSIDTKLDYDTLRQICLTGHSRVPVYEEVEIPTSKVIEARNKAGAAVAPLAIQSEDGKTMIVKRIIGILLVKQVRDYPNHVTSCAHYFLPKCVLLDPGGESIFEILWRPTDNDLSPQIRFRFARFH
jgi:hypothetical protein